MPCTKRARLPMYSFCGPSKAIALRLGVTFWPLRSTGMKLVMGTDAILWDSPLSVTIFVTEAGLAVEESGVPELLLRSLRQEERYDLPEFDLAALSVVPLAASELSVV